MAKFEDFTGQSINSIVVADVRGPQFDERHSFDIAFPSLDALESWMKEHWGFGLSFVTHVNDQKIEYQIDETRNSGSD